MLVSVTVADGAPVGVAVGALLADGVGVQVLVSDGVAVDVVSVPVGVAVSLRVAVGVAVGVSLGVAVTVGVGVQGTAPVGTYDGLLVISTTSSRELASRPRNRIVCIPAVSRNGLDGCWLACILSQHHAHCPPNWGSS